MDGVLVVDKPHGLTSHDVVAVARRCLNESRIGHTGTLDPLATGVLPLACGRATRLVRFLSASEKHYEATIRFGLTTDSYDVTGTEISRSDTVPTPRRSRRAGIDAWQSSAGAARILGEEESRDNGRTHWRAVPNRWRFSRSPVRLMTADLLDFTAPRREWRCRVRPVLRPFVRHTRWANRSEPVRAWRRCGGREAGHSICRGGHAG